MALSQIHSVESVYDFFRPIAEYLTLHLAISASEVVFSSRPVNLDGTTYDGIVSSGIEGQRAAICVVKRADNTLICGTSDDADDKEFKRLATPAYEGNPKKLIELLAVDATCVALSHRFAKTQEEAPAYYGGGRYDLHLAVEIAKKALPLVSICLVGENKFVADGIVAEKMDGSWHCGAIKSPETHLAIFYAAASAGAANASAAYVPAGPSLPAEIPLAEIPPAAKDSLRLE